MNKPGKRRAQRAARQLISDAGIKSAPVMVERVARSLKLLVQYRALDPELSGMIFVRDGLPVVVINETQHLNRQRFTIAHEIGHWVLHRPMLSRSVHVDKKLPVLLRDDASSHGDLLIEIEANAFAAELLMPEQFLRAEIESFRDILDIDDDDERVEELAKRYKVSTAAMRYRLLGFFGG